MLFSKNRCKVCKSVVGHRFCLRKSKHICWHCCNEMRSEFNCPTECEYTLRKKDNEDSALAVNCKVDSKTELDDLNKLITDYWINHKVDKLEDIPSLMLNDSLKSEKLHSYLESFEFPAEIKAYLYKRLNFEFRNENNEEKHFETIAITYLNHILCGELDKALNLFMPAIISNEYNYNLLLIHFKSHHSLRKLSEFDLISSGFAPQTKEAFVTFELNKNQEFTLIMTKSLDDWYINAQVFGAINLVRTENEALRFIAGALSEQNFEKAYRYITNYKQIYFYSSDLYYYEGLYYSLKGENKHAKQSYEIAIALDPMFIESYHNLAFICQAENELEKAKQLYEQIIAIKPDYLNALNNLGTIYLYEKNFDKAEELFTKCLEYDENFDYAIKNIEKIKDIREGKIQI